MMQVSKKIPFDDPQVLLGVRGLYLASNVVIVGLYLYLARAINYKKGPSDLLWSPVAQPTNNLGLGLSLTCDDRHDHPQIRGTCADGLG